MDTLSKLFVRSAVCVGALMFGLIGPANADEPKLSDLMTLIKLATTDQCVKQAA